MAFKLSLYAPEVANRNGQGLGLAFIYGDVAYYFSPDVWTDDDSSAYQKRGRDAVLGKEANEALLAAISEYGEKGGEVWMAAWFRPHVAAFLEEQKGGRR